MLDQSWVVIPAHNEGKVIRPVVLGVLKVVPRVVVVDDGSDDKTAAEAIAAGSTILRHAVNLGQGAALQTGIQYALSRGAQYIYTFDADGQHSPDALLALEAKLRETCADVVLGSRTLGRTEGMPTARRLMLLAAVAFTRIHHRPASFRHPQWSPPIHPGSGAAHQSDTAADGPCIRNPRPDSRSRTPLR